MTNSHANIVFSTTPCPLGFLLAATTARGLCAVTLGDDGVDLEAALRCDFANANIQRDDAALADSLAALLAHLRGEQCQLDLPLDVPATDFQRRVWQELRAIAYGQTRTYSEIAAALEQPRAARAVAHACASNPVALVVPCHRVLRTGGALAGYRWGIERKRALLQNESQK